MDRHTENLLNKGVNTNVPAAMLRCVQKWIEFPSFSQSSQGKSKYSDYQIAIINEYLDFITIPEAESKIKELILTMNQWGFKCSWEDFLEFASKHMNRPEVKSDVLKNPIEIILKETSKKVVEEISARKAIILTKGVSYVINSQPTSGNLMVNAKSGTGKDFVVRNTLSIFPKENSLRRTRITPTLFNYWHRGDREPSWTWDGKSVYLEDISEGVLNSPVFKVMSSGGSNTTLVINQIAYDIPINGKPSLIITTAASNPNNELLRRFPIVKLDETVDQTKAIVAKQAEAASTGESLEYNSLIPKELFKLRRVEVIIPFAEKIVEHLPLSMDVIMRTSFSRFLDYIKSSAALHQFVRSIDHKGRIIAEGEDYNRAREVLLATNSNQSMIPLPRNKEKVIELWKKGILDYDRYYSTTEVTSKVTWVSERQARVYLNQLTDMKFLHCKQKKCQYSFRPVNHYKLIQQEKLNLPLFLELEKQGSLLDEVNEVNELKKDGIVNNTLKPSFTSNTSISSNTSSTSNTEFASSFCVDEEDVIETKEDLAFSYCKENGEVPIMELQEKFGLESVSKLRSIGKLMESRSGFLRVVT